MSTQGAAQSISAKEVGQKLVELCKAGKNLEAVESLYSEDVVSVEAGGPPDTPREMSGKQAIRDKHHWWYTNHEVHSATTEGPYPKDDQFIVTFGLDVTHKASGQRFQMQEAGLYTVENGKIVREEFFYSM
ncbi:MAG: hypothetical protein NVS9B15_05360 [Acidobacteriaceae bacterium]